MNFVGCLRSQSGMRSGIVYLSPAIPWESSRSIISSSDQYFIFSSEVRTLLGTGLVPAPIDPAGLINYLTFGSLYDPNTLVEGVHALPPGCFLTWENGAREARRSTGI